MIVTRGGRSCETDRYRSLGASGRGGYGQRGSSEDWRRNEGRGEYDHQSRPLWDRASDEISSWFGDDDASNRRRQDQIRDEHARYQGVGPKNYKRSDDRMREDVSDRLSDDHYVNAAEIEVSVSNAEVTLAGTVDNRDQRRRAEMVAERVSGVTHVQNNLRVKSASQGVQGAGSQGSQETQGSLGQASHGLIQGSGQSGTSFPSGLAGSGSSGSSRTS